jgi:hypothetical protein
MHLVRVVSYTVVLVLSTNHFAEYVPDRWQRRIAKQWSIDDGNGLSSRILADSSDNFTVGLCVVIIYEYIDHYNACR